MTMTCTQRSCTHDTTPQTRPLVRPRVVGMAISKTGIGTPHHNLKLEELGEESRELVIDLWRIFWHYEPTWMLAQPLGRYVV
jgi:hypothetical protein